MPLLIHRDFLQCQNGCLKYSVSPSFILALINNMINTRRLSQEIFMSVTWKNKYVNSLSRRALEDSCLMWHEPIRPMHLFEPRSVCQAGKVCQRVSGGHRRTASSGGQDLDLRTTLHHLRKGQAPWVTERSMQTMRDIYVGTQQQFCAPLASGLSLHSTETSTPSSVSCYWKTNGIVWC